MPDSDHIDSTRAVYDFAAAHYENAYGSSSTITWYRHNIDDVVRGVGRAGFVLHSRIWRAAALTHETTPQGVSNVPAGLERGSISFLVLRRIRAVRVYC